MLTANQGDRSVSRGRDVYQSSGRGGAGNIRRASASRDARPDGPDDFSTPRGREPRPTHPADTSPNPQVFSTGRGGAGNIRSPSRDARAGAAETAVNAVEDQLIRSHIVAEQGVVHSTGRGGIGNMTGGSRSRSRARDTSHPGSGAHTPLHSSGRGGAGNIFAGHTPSVAEAEEKDAASHLAPRHSHDVHSTGRGGTANIVHCPAPPVEHTHHKQHPDSYESTGRGGAGNIVHT
ncbi:hypothetical protein AX14_006254 [Amanita brunnescens Koide BX004]|nr:hypothetical protein AX14_006254 [Amanita brunnescens Koide BX004]